MIVVVMGVAGVGKTTIGQLLANRLACEFLDADDFHPLANVAKMAAGTPLDDADRWPWLEQLNALLRERAGSGASAVLACSALKHAYRERLCCGVARCRLVYLHADERVLRARLAARTHHYMPATLLDSQLATLEPPEDALAVDATAPPEHCAQVIAAALTRP